VTWMFGGFFFGSGMDGWMDGIWRGETLWKERGREGRGEMGNDIGGGKRE
jgi:hypothetical protein